MYNANSISSHDSLSIIDIFNDSIKNNHDSTQVIYNHAIEFILNNKEKLGGRLLDNTLVKWKRNQLFDNGDPLRFSDFVMIENDTLLSKEDVKYFLSHYLVLQELENSKIEGLKAKSHKREYCKVSLPLFNEQGSKAILNISWFCGDECGTNSILVFEKVKGKWKITESRKSWII